MIYVNNPDLEEEEFITLLEETRRLLIEFLPGKTEISPIDFEDFVYKKMCMEAEETDYKGMIKKTGSHSFPDIIAKKYFGVEVKMTSKDHWTSTGNSVLESSRENVERIYIMFGKLGGEPDVRYRPYQECLPDISVTHSPRYHIDMNLPQGKSIFDKIGIGYDELRKDDDRILKIKDYYRNKLKDGEELWWIDKNDDKSSSFIIRPYRGLSKNEQERIKAEVMILFPEIFGESPFKFQRVSAYLVNEYSVIASNLRDLFTAGGKKELIIKGKSVLVPRIAYNMYSRAKMIKNEIKTMDTEKLSHYWRVKPKKNRLNQWKKLLDKNFDSLKHGVKASDIFDYGIL